MNGSEIAIAAVVFMLVGIGLALLGVFCFVMLKMMGKLQDAAQEATRGIRETLAEARSLVAQAKEVSDRNFGENSAISKAAKSVSTLANTLPETMAGLKQFTEVFSEIYRTAFVPSKTANEAVQPSRFGDDSQFIPYSEEGAAQAEVEHNARRQRVELSKEELSVMRTDKEPTEFPEPVATDEPASAVP